MPTLGCTQAFLWQQGVDWRDPRAAACNGARNPVQQNFYDGINVDALEVLFIKVKASMRRAGWDHVAQVRHEILDPIPNIV